MPKRNKSAIAGNIDGLNMKYLVECIVIAGVIILTAVTGHAAILSAVNVPDSPASVSTLQFDKDNVFGWRFTPAADISVTALGYFDSTTLTGGTGTGLLQSHDVGIYSSTGTLLASATVPSGTAGSLVNHFRFVDLTSPVTLGGGQTYMMAAFYSGFATLTGSHGLAGTNAFTMSNGISFSNPAGTGAFVATGEGGLAKPPTTLVFPTVADTPLIPTFAGDFEFSTVPEPGALAIGGIALPLLLHRRGRRCRLRI